MTFSASNVMFAAFPKSGHNFTTTEFNLNNLPSVTISAEGGSNFSEKDLDGCSIKRNEDSNVFYLQFEHADQSCIFTALVKSPTGSLYQTTLSYNLRKFVILDLPCRIK